MTKKIINYTLEILIEKAHSLTQNKSFELSDTNENFNSSIMP